MKKEKKFEPYIPAERDMPEQTMTSVVLGIILAVLFGGANAYLGLRVGMAVSASIPAAVISMGIIRMLLRRDSILENNMVQTIGSAGESLAAGAVFTMPALFMWAEEGKTQLPSLLEITLITFCGGALGVLFMVPLRKALIVKEHERLPYPEGTACAEVLLAGEKKGAAAGTVFAGLLVSAFYKFLADGLKIFPSEVDHAFKSYSGAGVGVDVLPALVGVGFICGPKIASYMLAGGVLGWLVLMPLISLLGAESVIYPGTVPISSMTTWQIWSNYIKYIGAGTVLAGGIISLLRSLPLIIRTFQEAAGGFRFRKEEGLRTERDLPIGVVFLGIVALAVLIWILPAIPVNLTGTLIIIIFGFFFATVSSRMVGLVGSSNNPVSGMAIATLLIATMILRRIGNVGVEGMVTAITIGTITCIVTAMAGDTSQDLKTGYLLGATPIKQQIGELIGTLAAAAAIGAILYLLNAAWGYGSGQLPAPQATLMKMVVEGVMEGNLPWDLVWSGVGIAAAMQIVGLPVLPLAVGLYLPLHLSTPIMAGGLIRLYLEKKKGIGKEERKKRTEKGTLYASGLIAGEGMTGILLAVCTILPVKGKSLAERIDLSEMLYLGNAGGLLFFVLLLGSFFLAVSMKNKA